MILQVTVDLDHEYMMQLLALCSSRRSEVAEHQGNYRCSHPGAMALIYKLHYRRTFIDMDEEPWHSPRARAASCPPSMREGEESNEEQEESKAHELYLEKVVREASKFHARRSRGSIGHPEVCRRPCVFLAAGRCGQGENCGYCHCEHNEPRARPDKKQRAALQGLQQDDLFAVVLPHLQVRAELPQLRGKATQLLRIVEDISVTTSPCASPSASSSCTSSSTLSDSKLKSLNKTLERMTFSGLVALLCESIAKGNTRDELLQALEDMRAQCDIPP
ncbi:PGC [Symbiodinium sp. CCMP2592]|nr:PGC [Symbiodinium sp. CCMP2592]